MADRPPRLLRRLTGHGDELDDLLGAEGGRFPGPRGVVEDQLHQPAELLRGLLLLDTLQDLHRFAPAVAPGAHRHAGQSQLPGHRLDAGLSRQGENQGSPAHQTLIGGLLALNPSQDVLLCRGDPDRGRSWSSHKRAPSTKAGTIRSESILWSPAPFWKIIFAALY